MTTQNTKDFISGLLLVLGINLAVFILGLFVAVPLMLSSNAAWASIFSPLLFIGLGQWLYIIPWAWHLQTRNHPMRNGIITGGIITLLINGSCFGPMLIQQVFPT